MFSTLPEKTKAVLIALLLLFIGLGLWLLPTRHPDGYLQELQAKEMSTDLEVQIEEVKAGLSPEQQVEAQRLELAWHQSSEANRTAAADTLIRYWGQINPAVAAIFAKKKAEETHTESDLLDAAQRFLTVVSVMTEEDKSWAAVEAAGLFRQVLKTAPQLLEARRGLGTAMVEGAGAPMEGIGMLTEILEEYPNDVETILRLGHFSVLSSQFPKAVERFQQVLSIDSSRSEVYFLLGDTWLKAGNQDSAKVYFGRYRARLPSGMARSSFDAWLVEIGTKK
jgi:tetratricopeptide (TPR) repeat protein